MPVGLQNGSGVKRLGESPGPPWNIFLTHHNACPEIVPSRTTSGQIAFLLLRNLAGLGPKRRKRKSGDFKIFSQLINTDDVISFFLCIIHGLARGVQYTLPFA
jgi:hypothetical protein